MPYAKCPNCGQICHYAVSVENLKEWYKKHGAGEKALALCFGCWKELKVGDIVSVLSKPKEKSLAKIGDIGAIMAIYGDAKNLSYKIKSEMPNGNTKWIDTFKRNEIRYELKLNKK